MPSGEPDRPIAQSLARAMPAKISAGEKGQHPAGNALAML
jgi:hypothetical protein